MAVTHTLTYKVQADDQRDEGVLYLQAIPVGFDLDSMAFEIVSSFLLEGQEVADNYVVESADGSLDAGDLTDASSFLIEEATISSNSDLVNALAEAENLFHVAMDLYEKTDWDLLPEEDRPLIHGIFERMRAAFYDSEAEATEKLAGMRSIYTEVDPFLAALGRVNRMADQGRSGEAGQELLDSIWEYLAIADSDIAVVQAEGVTVPGSAEIALEKVEAEYDALNELSADPGAISGLFNRTVEVVKEVKQDLASSCLYRFDTKVEEALKELGLDMSEEYTDDPELAEAQEELAARIREAHSSGPLDYETPLSALRRLQTFAEGAKLDIEVVRSSGEEADEGAAEIAQLRSEIAEMDQTAEAATEEMDEVAGLETQLQADDATKGKRRRLLSRIKELAGTVRDKVLQRRREDGGSYVSRRLDAVVAEAAVARSQHQAAAGKDEVELEELDFDAVQAHLEAVLERTRSASTGEEVEQCEAEADALILPLGLRDFG